MFFTDLWLKRHKLNIETLLANYLYRSISYQIIDYYRKKEVAAKHRTLLQVIQTEFDNSTEETIHVNDLKQAIDYEVSLLPAKCRSVYELSRKQYKSNKEIASYLNISEKTVENHLSKAIKRIRLSLSHYLLVLLFLFK